MEKIEHLEKVINHNMPKTIYQNNYKKLNVIVFYGYCNYVPSETESTVAVFKVKKKEQ